jgi:hypothetical protein
MNTNKKSRDKITFLVLDLSLDIVDCITALDLERDSLPSQGFHEDLHLASISLSHSPYLCAAPRTEEMIGKTLARSY